METPLLLLMEEEGGSGSYALMLTLLETFTSIGTFRVSGIDDRQLCYQYKVPLIMTLRRKALGGSMPNAASYGFSQVLESRLPLVQQKSLQEACLTLATGKGGKAGGRKPAFLVSAALR